MKNSRWMRILAPMLMTTGMAGSALAQTMPTQGAPAASAPAQSDAATPSESPTQESPLCKPNMMGRSGMMGGMMRRSGMVGARGMMGMMGQCMSYCQAVSSDASAEKLKKLREVRESNDPAVLRAALDEVIKTLETHRDQMEACLEMMGGPGNTQSGAEKDQEAEGR